MPDQTSLVINGWTVFCHPLFLDELDSLIEQAEVHKEKDPQNFGKKNATKRLAAIAKLAFEVIPQDPSLPDYRQGGTLGNDHKHWFRAKFFQQYRLFFRFESASKIIVFVWVNDEKNKRGHKRGPIPSDPPPFQSDFTDLISPCVRANWSAKD